LPVVVPTLQLDDFSYLPNQNHLPCVDHLTTVRTSPCA
jgi:hypothetical protein